MDNRIKNAVEMALLCADGALPLAALKKLFPPGSGIGGGAIQSAIEALRLEWQTKALEIKQTAGGYQFVTRAEYAEYLPRLANEKPPRLSRRLLEVLAVVAYRQPATRGDIERIRGVATSPQHLRFLEECGWIEAVGRRETPGRPMMFATTVAFLDDLGLRSLEELPPPDELESLEVSENESDPQTAAAPNGADESDIAAASLSPNGESETGDESETESAADPPDDGMAKANDAAEVDDAGGEGLAKAADERGPTTNDGERSPAEAGSNRQASVSQKAESAAEQPTVDSPPNGAAQADDASGGEQSPTKSNGEESPAKPGG